MAYGEAEGSAEGGSMKWLQQLFGRGGPVECRQLPEVDPPSKFTRGFADEAGHVQTDENFGVCETCGAQVKACVIRQRWRGGYGGEGSKVDGVLAHALQANVLALNRARDLVVHQTADAEA